MESEKKILLWSTPRSLSTAFLRAMMNIEESQTILEPFGQAYYFSEERPSKWYMNCRPKKGCTYPDVKSQLENPTHGRRLTFVKDMAYYVAFDDSFQPRIPRGYTHTFIIRHPKKTVSSLYKVTKNIKTGLDNFIPETYGYEELHKMFIHVTEELGQKTVLIEADDLCRNPESIMRQYCHAVGLQYTDNVVHWRSDTLDMEVLADWPLTWFTTLLNSTTFNPEAVEDPNKINLDMVPEDSRNAIDLALPYYETLRTFKLKP